VISDSHRQARNLKMTQECLVSDVFHKHGLKEGPNKEHLHKHAGEHAHSNQAYAKELRRLTCWTQGGAGGGGGYQLVPAPQQKDVSSV